VCQRVPKNSGFGMLNNEKVNRWACAQQKCRFAEKISLMGTEGRVGH